MITRILAGVFRLCYCRRSFGVNKSAPNNWNQPVLLEEEQSTKTERFAIKLPNSPSYPKSWHFTAGPIKRRKRIRNVQWRIWWKALNKLGASHNRIESWDTVPPPTRRDDSQRSRRVKERESINYNEIWLIAFKTVCIFDGPWSVFSVTDLPNSNTRSSNALLLLVTRLLT